MVNGEWSMVNKAWPLLCNLSFTIDHSLLAIIRLVM